MQVNIEKRHMIVIFAGLLLLAGSIYVYAYVNPATGVGHSADEIELPSDVCRTDGTSCPVSVPAWKDLTAENNITNIPADVPPGFMHGYCVVSGTAGCSNYYAITPCSCSGGTSNVARCDAGYILVKLDSTTSSSTYSCIRDKPTHP